MEVLEELKDLCYQLDWDQEYDDFRLLYFAKYDLEEYGDQYYWHEGDNDSTDFIIRERFKLFLNEGKRS